MSAATVQASGAQQASRGQIGEWFWRFLAVVMLAVIGWVVWIAIQISPPAMVLPAAYEAAAQGRALRNSGGSIGPSTDTVALQAPSDSTASPIMAAVAVVEPAVQVPPPVNLDKLRMAETIDTPIFERTRRPARPAADAGQ
jgi:hypothetical protein